MRHASTDRHARLCLGEMHSATTVGNTQHPPLCARPQLDLRGRDRFPTRSRHGDLELPRSRSSQETQGNHDEGNPKRAQTCRDHVPGFTNRVAASCGIAPVAATKGRTAGMVMGR